MLIFSSLHSCSNVLNKLAVGHPYLRQRCEPIIFGVTVSDGSDCDCRIVIESEDLVHLLRIESFHWRRIDSQHCGCLQQKPERNIHLSRIPGFDRSAFHGPLDRTLYDRFVVRQFAAFLITYVADPVDEMLYVAVAER